MYMSSHVTYWLAFWCLLRLPLGLGYILMPTQRFTLDKKILHILPWQLLTKSSPTLHCSDQESGWLSYNTNILIWCTLYCDRRPLSSSLDDAEDNLVVSSILAVLLNKSGRQGGCCGSKTEHMANGSVQMWNANSVQVIRNVIAGRQCPLLWTTCVIRSIESHYFPMMF